ncbi:cytochrome C [Subsaximicrobium wynnwilliamsii]|jgi:cytochrome c553|uniref:Cytochrome C n=1 Tax=Subsaximicrobium wynnwilliamsii TaxID=291179 RepID=A0A5C6ZKH9_9FLAO|nr:heme-binding domain-containing protein [Subsaximicrobium wynnwilliamsii]TXD84835.1 cytochrome C [Subsaximicrobium wynnwilliamsii]TXD90506.1 cytochrome C [Subsaximicrobium wynnwilliamsii]TXE04981.1 cytochrome C [Subsaximicrobium wynnwilliamsii]
MKVVKKILVVLLIVLVIMQFFAPKKNQGDLASLNAFTVETNMPKNVQSIFENTCYDCHSDYTRYPWYDRITPLNYWLADHIEEGKEHFNASSWDRYTIKKKDHKLEELIEEVEKKNMPLESYTYTHAEAKLSDEEIKAVVAWAKTVRAGYNLVSN